MPRYFIEVAYKGDRYSGFQEQQNANTIQAEVSHALEVFYKQKFSLTGSSRTDAGVHALQNFFHFDVEEPIANPDWNVYNLNAILSDDIAVKQLFLVKDDAHCRFDALSREYKYVVYNKKDPFLHDAAFYSPYPLDIAQMNEAAKMLFDFEDFTSFSKRNTQVKNFICKIMESHWKVEDGCVVYHVKSNRFLRGMVKGLVGTMLRVGRGIITLENFREIILAKDCSKADFSVASHGLYLVRVEYGEL